MILLACLAQVAVMLLCGAIGWRSGMREGMKRDRRSLRILRIQRKTADRVERRYEGVRGSEDAA